MSDTQRDLDEWIVTELDDEARQLDDVTADQALRSLSRLERDEEQIKATAQAERDVIDAWERDRRAGIAERRKWLTHRLDGYARATGSKTIRLAWGTLRLRPLRKSIEITKDAPAHSLAERDPDLWANPAPKLIAAEAIKHYWAGSRLVNRLPQPTDPPGKVAHQAMHPSGAELPGVIVWVPEGRDSLTITLEDPYA